MNQSTETPRIERVEWLIKALNLDNRQQAYDAIAAGYVPKRCIIKIGRRIRVNVDEINKWLNGGHCEGGE